MKLPLDRTTINVIILGLAFMFIFTSFQTQGNMQVGLPLNSGRVLVAGSSAGGGRKGQFPLLCRFWPLVFPSLLSRAGGSAFLFRLACMVILQ